MCPLGSPSSVPGLLPVGATPGRSILGSRSWGSSLVARRSLTFKGISLACALSLGLGQAREEGFLRIGFASLGARARAGGRVVIAATHALGPEGPHMLHGVANFLARLQLRQSTDQLVSFWHGEVGWNRYSHTRLARSQVENGHDSARSIHVCRHDSNQLGSV